MCGRCEKVQVGFSLSLFLDLDVVCESVSKVALFYNKLGTCAQCVTARFQITQNCACGTKRVLCLWRSVEGAAFRAGERRGVP